MANRDYIKTVQDLIIKAEHPSTPAAEAQACRERADAIMFKHSIEEAMLDFAIPEAQRQKPTIITVALSGDEGLVGYMAGMARDIAKFTRCIVRNYTTWTDGAWNAKVYGYQSDVEYFQILYTNVRLHMLGALRPKWDPTRTLGENAYFFHNAGFNWLDMARENGWRKASYTDIRVWMAAHPDHPADDDPRDFKDPWINLTLDVVEPSMRMGSRYKRAYRAECKLRNEPYTTMAPGAAESFRKDAAHGYITRIFQRLRAMEAHREPSDALVLRADAVTDAYREDQPENFYRCPSCLRLSADEFTCDLCGKQIKERPPAEAEGECPRCKVAQEEFMKGKRSSPWCRDHKPRAYRGGRERNEAGWAAGVAQANTADLGQHAAGHSSTAIS